MEYDCSKCGGKMKKCIINGFLSLKCKKCGHVVIVEDDDDE